MAPVSTWPGTIGARTMIWRSIMGVTQRRLLQYFLVTAAIAEVFVLPRGLQWRGSESLHTNMEVLATALALMIGCLALVRFYARKDSLFLFIGAGFLGTAILDGYHAVVTTAFFQDYMPSELGSLIPWSWVASRQFLSILIFLSWLAWFGQSRLGLRATMSEKAVFSFTAAFTIASFLFFAFVPLPSAYYLELYFHRPEEFGAGLFFALALIGFLYKGSWRDNDFEHWLILSLILGVLGQTLFMSASHGLFDLEFDIAHALKMASYVCVLTGLVINMYAIFQQEEQSRIVLAENLKRLRESEENFRGLIEGSVQGMCIRKNKRIIYANEALARMFGYSGEELMGMDVYDLVPPHSAQSIREVEHLPHVADFELEGMKRDGTQIWYVATGSAIEWESGPARLITYLDSTVRKKAEEALRKSEASLTNAQRLAHVGSWDWDLISGQMHRSEEVYRILGVSAEETDLSYEAYLELVHADDWENVVRTFEASLAGRIRHQMDYRIIRPNGEIRVIREEGEVMFDDDGQPVSMSGTVQDITERKRTEDALRDSEQKYRTIIDTANEGFWRLDTGLKIIEVNDALCRMLKCSREDLIGMCPFELREEVTDAAFESDIRTKLTSRDAGKEWEGRFRRLDGTLMDVRISGTTMWGDDGQPIGRFGFISDITEQKMRDEQLRQSQKMEAVGQLTGGVAHDFNNLLAIVLGNLELAEEMARDGKDVGPLLRNAISGTRRGADLTQRLLAYSRQQVLAPKVIDLNEVIAETTDLLGGTLGEHIEIERVIDNDLWSCKADPSQIESALVNLALNARDSMPRGGRLTIATSNANLDRKAAAAAEVEPGEYVALTVTDSGAGMPADILERIFEPFFTTKDVGEGSGLGLSMVFGFVKQSGGHVTVESEVGKGTTFRIFLPRSVEAKPEIAPERPADSDAVTGEETVFVVEDDPDLRSLAATLLDSLGYKVLDAGCGSDALEILERGGHVDLLLTDVILPGGMSGPELVEQVRRKRPDTKILYMSGYTEKSIDETAKINENEPFLQKPFRKRDLAVKVREVLD